MLDFVYHLIVQGTYYVHVGSPNISTFLYNHAQNTPHRRKMRIIITIVAVLSVVASGQEEMCTRGAEFTISFDVVASADFFQNVRDPNLTFFREVLQFTEQEIETAAQSAIEFFNTTYGLDFSESVPNEQGERFFQNASFSAGKIPFTATAKANRWLVNGNTKSRCFDARIGWFGVIFQDKQVLHGTYGGPEGRTIGPTSLYALSWSYLSINTCPQSPVLMQMQTCSPEANNADGINIGIFSAFHRSLGNGIRISVFYPTPLPPDQRLVRLRFYSTMIFPADDIP